MCCLSEVFDIKVKEIGGEHRVTRLEEFKIVEFEEISSWKFVPHSSSFWEEVF